MPEAGPKSGLLKRDLFSAREYFSAEAAGRVLKLLRSAEPQIRPRNVQNKHWRLVTLFADSVSGHNFQQHLPGWRDRLPLTIASIQSKCAIASKIILKRICDD